MYENLIVKAEELQINDLVYSELYALQFKVEGSSQFVDKPHMVQVYCTNAANRSAKWALLFREGVPVCASRLK